MGDVFDDYIPPRYDRVTTSDKANSDKPVDPRSDYEKGKQEGFNLGWEEGRAALLVDIIKAVLNSG